MTTATNAPQRGDSLMNATETLVTQLATADRRFVATFDHQLRMYVLRDRREGRTYDLLADINEVKRTVAEIVDHEHKCRVAEYTRELAQQDPEVAAFVARMRRAAAAHGRAMGTVGMWMSDHDGKRELTVYVDRSEYAALLADSE